MDTSPERKEAREAQASEGDQGSDLSRGRNLDSGTLVENYMETVGLTVFSISPACGLSKCAVHLPRAGAKNSNAQC